MNELRHALRRATRQPAFSLIVAVTLGLGIGGSAAARRAVRIDPMEALRHE